MKINKKRLLLPFFIFALLLNFVPFGSINVLAAGVKPVVVGVQIPQITSIEHNEAQTMTRPLITGISQANTEVMLYIDGTYAGNASVRQIDKEKESFRFYSSVDLAAGSHKVFAIAKDPTSLRLSPPSPELGLYIIPLPAPTLIQPNPSTVTGNVRELITGLTVSDSRVHVYIDGRYNGTTAILTHESGTANFAYKPFLNLSVGRHTAWAVAEDSLGRVSGKSNILKFKIEEPYPAPTLFAPTEARGIVAGLAKNDSLIKIFVDQKLDGEFKVVNHESGTANFAYKLKQKLGSGKHLIFATAVDGRGKESRWSNFVYYSAAESLEPAITNIAAEEEAGQEAGGEGENQILSAQRLRDLIVSAKIFKTNQDVRIKDRDLADLEIAIKNKDRLNINPEDLKALENLLSAKKEEKEKISDRSEGGSSGENAAAPEESKNNEIDEIKNILEQDKASTSEETGLINEAKENQGKLKLNLIIFIGFLLAVIVWIFWVNRELIKERREENIAKDKKSSEKEKN